MVDMGQADRTLYRCGNTSHNEDVFKKSREKQRRLDAEEERIRKHYEPLREELKNAGWTDEQIEEEIAMLREWGEYWGKELTI